MKKIVKILLIVLILSMASISHAAEPFSDVGASHWAHDSIQWGVQNNLVKGYPDGTYRPAQQISEQEFATILAKYIFKDQDLQNSQTNGWSNNYYKSLQPYSLPFSGYNNESVRANALTRGDLARIVAAKNGFNLDEIQAVYYMYENDISYGLKEDRLTFESYGTTQAVKREQIPAFMQRLESTGHTTFLGNQSEVTDASDIEGISGVAKANTVITDEMFDALAKDKGIINPTPPPLGTLENPIIMTVKESKDGVAEFRDMARANPELATRMVGKINGIVTPVYVNYTMADPDSGLVLRTKYDKITPAFNDVDLFNQIVDEYWAGALLDANQVKHIKLLQNEPKFVQAYIVKGSKYDILISGSSGSVAVDIITKGSQDSVGFPVKQ